MFSAKRRLSIAIVVLTGWLATNALGQSLAISRYSTNETWLDATSPAKVGYRFQTSVDYTTWSDVGDAASGPVSYRIDTTTNAASFFRLRTWSTAEAPMTLALIGDSTVADRAVNDNRFYGWGGGIYGYLKPNVRAANLAQPLQTTELFLSSIQKDHLMTIKPEFVLIHFGWMDSSGVEPFHTSVPEYEANLKTIVKIVRDFLGTPILLTPTGPRYFGENGRVLRSIEDRCEAVRNVAVEFQTYLIDLNRFTETLYDELGEAKSKSDYIASSPDDPAHFSLNGATIVAGLVVKAFPGILRDQVIQP